jgi:hypothetical protein
MAGLAHLRGVVCCLVLPPEFSEFGNRAVNVGVGDMAMRYEPQVPD